MDRLTKSTLTIKGRRNYPRVKEAETVVEAHPNRGLQPSTNPTTGTRQPVQARGKGSEKDQA